MVKNTKFAFFRGGEIAQHEAKCLEELEKFARETFILVSEVTSQTKMGFSVANKRVFGISIHLTGLENLPESIRYLKNLNILDCTGNSLTTIPASIGKLSSLEYLNLSGNKLQDLPNAIGNLKSLKIVFLHFNNLSTLPESICKLPSLEKLFLFKNRTLNLPECIKSLKERGVMVSI